MYNKLFAFLIAAMAISCMQESASDTIMGYNYEHAVKTDAKKPGPGEYVLYHYFLRDQNGKILEDSRSKQPTSTFRIPPEDAYPKKAPLIELMKLMSVGDSARLIYPIDSLPQGGRERFGDITELIYEVVIQDVKTEAEYAVIQEEQDAARRAEQAKNQEKVDEIAGRVAQVLADYKSGALDSEIKKVGDLEYVVHEMGTGPVAKAGIPVQANYYGVLKSDGSMFDNSFSRGQPFRFQVGKGQVIQGWDIGFAQLPEGSKATLFIPYQMAYGESGRPPQIPAKSDLVFYVELDKVEE